MSATSSLTSRQETKIEAVSKVPPLYRSRTDSVILYTAPSIVEAAGSTFYIRKNGQIDYNVLLKVNSMGFWTLTRSIRFHTLLIQALHKITLRENICTVRVCEAVLSLTSTLIDLGVLANNTKALLSSLVKSGDDNKAAEAATAPPPPAAASNEDNNEIAAGRPPSANDTKDNDNKAPHSPETATTPEASKAEKVATFSLHNTFMDIVIRQAFHFGSLSSLQSFKLYA